MASKSKREKAAGNSAKDLKKKVTSNGNDYKTHSGANDGSTSDATSCISLGDTTSSIKEGEVDQEALIAVQSIYYPVNGVYGYYYPGFDGSMGDWDDNGYFWGSPGVELQYFGNQSENGSMYYFPGFSPFGPVSPGAVFGVDGECLTQQVYYSCPMYSQTMVSPGFLPQATACGPEHFPAFVWDVTPALTDGLHGNDFVKDTAVPYAEPNYSCQNGNIKPSKGLLSSSATFRKKGSAAVLDSSQHTASQNQAPKSLNKVNNDLSKNLPPSSKVHSVPVGEKDGLLFPSLDNVKEAGRTLVGMEKQKAAYNTQETCNLDLLNGQNHEPRTTCNHGALFTSCESTAVPWASNKNGGPVFSKKEDYNSTDFDTKYDHALFFIIKSYSEDDIHKSIKYGVWASTPNGNRRLDTAFQVALEKVADKGSKSPVFLFFSVNASGQFCGVAEMIGQVDFNKNMVFWQQDKWNGHFPVKWHIIKDIPNRQFRHIILENNDNKPVTNSRDTQEVKFLQGIEMLNIFKNYSAKTSILDDFDFYESREKAMQEKRMKPTTTRFAYLTLNTEAGPRVKEAADLKSSAREEFQAGPDASAKEWLVATK